MSEICRKCRILFYYNRRLPCWQYRVHCVHTVLPAAREKMVANPPRAFYTTKNIKSLPDGSEEGGETIKNNIF